MRQLSLPAILVSVILPLILFAGFLGVREFKHQTASALDRRQSIAELGAQLIHEKFDGVIDVGVSLASRPLVYQNVKKGDWDEAAKNMEGITQVFPYIERVALLDKEGVLWAAVPPMPEAVGKSFAYRDYYQGVSSSWAPYVSEAYKRFAEPMYNVVSVVVPIQSFQKEVVGILVLTIELDAIVKWSEEVSVGRGGFIFIVDKRGQLVAHPRLKSSYELIDYSSLPIVRKLMDGDYGVGIHDRDLVADEEYVVAYYPVKEYGFGIGVVQSTPLAFAGRKRQAIEYALFWSAIILGASLFLYRILKDREIIKNQRDRERIFLESIADGVVAIDCEWRIMLWNKEAGMITGWSEAEAIGRPFREVVRFIRERDRKEDTTFIEEALVMKRHSSMKEDMLLIRKDGSDVAVGDCVAPIIDQNGDLKGAIIVFRDISKEREEMRLRSDFAYASHQLRTPITEALWNLEIARDEEDRQKRIEDLDIVRYSLESIQKLSEHLLTVSEIDNGLVSAKKMTVGVASILSEIQDSLETKAGECNVKLLFSPISALAVFDTDPKLFKKALYEIVENAILYSPAGSEVKVDTTLEKKDLFIEVSDGGVGISCEELPVLFTKFFRASSRPKKVAGGGLGLYIAREYVKALGGKIWFKSEECKGTTFFILLPIA